MTTARHKLNAAACYGAIVVACGAGFLFQSLLVGLITWIILIAGALHDGSIRPGPTKSRRR